MRKAQEKDIKVYLYFVALADPELNKRRVQTRIAQGGQPVAEEKIIECYYVSQSSIRFYRSISQGRPTNRKS